MRQPAVHLLAFDTSTEHLTAAVQRGGQTWAFSGAGGAQSSTSLIPALQDLMRQAGLAFAQLDVIAFGSGPGSFTGLRTACSVAQGLGFGAGVQLLPVPTLLAVAEEVRERDGERRIVAALDARMDELYAANYDFDSMTAPFHEDIHLVSPENLEIPPGFVLAGNAHAAYGARIASGGGAAGGPVSGFCGRICPALPTAAAMLRLCPALLAAGQAVDAQHALPHYIRDKVAKTTREREAEKRAAGHSNPGTPQP
jgi:tRNA threonylcarbamoyladenosine biosynthesis protein TsaB